MTQAEKAAHLRALHRAGKPLVIFNCWDVVTGRMLEDAGFPAAATSSAAVCFANGYRDGQQIGREAMLAAVAPIAAALSIPVSFDLEGGYGTDVESAVATARGAIAAGAAGMNFEDSDGETGGLLDAAAQAGRIAAVRKVADEAGVPLFINARCDAFFWRGVPEGEQMGVALERAHRYVEAGADGVFYPGILTTAQIERLVKETGAPVNVLMMEGNPPYEELARLNVARISYGVKPQLMALHTFGEAAREALAGRVADRPMADYGALEALFADR